MATIGSGALTYADWAKRVDDDGKTAQIIELLSQTNEILDDMLVVEGNLPTGHKTTIRTGLPTATWRLLNYGVATSKSTTAQVTDNCGSLEAYSVVDKKLADLNGDTGDFRVSEDMAFLESLNQQMAGTLFYGNTTVNPERFLGFGPRYYTVTPANSQLANNVIDMGGTQSTNTSVYVVCWGPNTVHGIFPKGKKGGLQHIDKGDIVPAYDANNNRYEAYTTHFEWEMGLTVRDWRYIVRLANIDINMLISGTGANLINGLIRAVHRLPTTPKGVANVQKTDAPDGGMTMGRCAIYVNRTIATYLDIQAVNKTNVLLKIEEWDGMSVTTFRGIPIRTVDQLLNTEARAV